MTIITTSCYNLLNMIKDKTQQITSYISCAGVKIYETLQFNKDCNNWFIVGDSSENKKLIESRIKLHNYKF